MYANKPYLSMRDLKLLVTTQKPTNTGISAIAFSVLLRLDKPTNLHKITTEIVTKIRIIM